MTHKFFIFCLFCLLSSGVSFSQDWQQIRSAEEVCSAYPEKMEYIFENLDLSYPGLEKVKEAFDKNELSKACSLLLEYYKKSDNAQRLKKQQPNVSLQNTSLGDSILQDIYVFQMVGAKVPRLDDDHLKWDYTGPEDDIEWAWMLNRHHPVSFIFSEYFKTGNPQYARYIDSFVKDWIIESWPYPAQKSSTAMWRGLEVSFRVKMWSQVFYGLMSTDYISPATRLLILSSLPDHADYAHNFHAQGNWLTMEMSGLATLATSWPEFKKSSEWLKYTINAMTESMKEQVYPDGVQTELTSHYHSVALGNFYLFYEICEQAGVVLPEHFTSQIEKMWNYTACTMRPNGTGLLNNDSDLDFNRNRVLEAASRYERTDWEYIASNGKSGTKPESGLSFVYPWAGQLISRSGYDAEAQWSFFDFGPWGSGHQHNDKLHISVSAYGRDLLVDAGRFAYRGEVAEKFRGYAKGSQGHNVLLIDGKGQAPGPKVAEEPVSTTDYQISKNNDFARGSFEDFKGLEGKSKHTRTLFYSRGNFWVVVDQVSTDQPRKIETLWHWHPDCQVQIREQKVFSVNDYGNLQIIPADDTKWLVQKIEGQEKPEIQGWYSREYNTYKPSAAIVYSTDIGRDSTFVWVLFPSEKSESGVQAQIVSKSAKEIKVKITNQDNKEWEVAVPLK